MKNKLQILLFCLFAIMFATSKATSNPNDIIKIGTKLIYDVNYLGTNYEMVVTVKDDTKDYIFDWQMSEPANKSGTLNFGKENIENATGIFNYFTNENNNLDNQCCIILSHKMYNNFNDNVSMEIITDKKNNFSSVFGKAYNHTQNFGYKNDFSNEFNCITVNDGKDYVITYVNDENFPLIIEMRLDWSMKLKNIEN